MKIYGGILFLVLFGVLLSVVRTSDLVPATREGRIRLRSGVVERPQEPSGNLQHSRPSVRGFPWIVLFDAPIQPAWKAAVEGAGARIHAYIPDHALLVEASKEVLERLGGLPHVAGGMEYVPAAKLEPGLADLARSVPDQRVEVLVQTFSRADAPEVERRLEALGASNVYTPPQRSRRFGLVRAELSAGAVATAAQLPEVCWMERRHPARLFNDFAAASERLDVEPLRAVGRLNGSGQVVAMADSGADSGDMATLHPDLAGAVIAGGGMGGQAEWRDFIGHGTHVAGSILGRGVASKGRFCGMAPAASLVVQNFINADGEPDTPDDLAELFLPPHEMYGAYIHSDSWGFAIDGDYDIHAQTADEFVWEHPNVLVVVAAGNAGVDHNRDGVVDLNSVSSPGSAKNVLTVGAAESGRAAGTGGDTAFTYGELYSQFPASPIAEDLVSSSPEGVPPGMAAFSARGPTKDGRCKPDVCAPGTDIVSVRSRAAGDPGADSLYPNETNYLFMSGTSMATPLISGGAALVRQYAVERLGFATPSAALLKAALAGGARSLSPGQYGTGATREIPALPRPNSVEGWGMADIAGTLFPGEGTRAILTEGETAFSSPNESHSRTLDIASSNHPLTAVLCWSDAPSFPAAATHLVNDLDLTLTAPDGTVFYPGETNSPDRLNNLEGLDIAAPAPGRWTLTVTAHNLPEPSQPYALYLRGAILQPPVIRHTPLQNQIATSGVYTVSADIFSPGLWDTNAVFLHAQTDEDPALTLPMTSTADDLFSAAIPAAPTGALITYHITADGVTNGPHTFAITPPLEFTIDCTGTPEGDVVGITPAPGTYTFASGTVIRASAPALLEGDEVHRRFRCGGWMGSGAAPANGTTHHCEFTLTASSTLTWQYLTQWSLTQPDPDTIPSGGVALISWHDDGATVDSFPYPARVRLNDGPASFSGMTIDGEAVPPPVSLQYRDLLMNRAHILDVLYSPDTAIGPNGLPVWFNSRFFDPGVPPAPLDDPDGDGYDNAIEALDRSDPLDPASVPLPPVILHTPPPPPVTNALQTLFFATVTDNADVAAVTLHWQRNDTLFRDTPMIRAENDLWSVLLPIAVTDGDRFTYAISATDIAGFSARSPEYTLTLVWPVLRFTQGSTDPVCTSLPSNEVTTVPFQIANAGSSPLNLTLAFAPYGFSDSAENGPNGWTCPDSNTLWHITSRNFYSPSNSWYCGPESWLPTYPNLADASLVSPPIFIRPSPAGQPVPRLEFMHWARFEGADYSASPPTYFDGALLDISTNNGSSWAPLAPDGGYPAILLAGSGTGSNILTSDSPCFGNTSGWEPVTASLAAYTGQTIRIRFRFLSDEFVTNEGWRLDDIRITPATTHLSSPPDGGWATLDGIDLAIPPDTNAPFTLTLAPVGIPCMGTDAQLLTLTHNDPNLPSPLYISLFLQNATRRLTVTSEGPGSATPAGDTFYPRPLETAVQLTPAPGHSLVNLLTNGTLDPAVCGTVTALTYAIALPSNLTIHAVFAPLLAEDDIPSADWLSAYGLTNRPPAAEGALDPDRDGLLTWQEAQLRSDPTDPADAPLLLRPLPMAPSDDATLRFTWHAFTNPAATYHLFLTTNLPGGRDTHQSLTNLPALPPIMTSPPLPRPPAPFFVYGLDATLP